MGYLCEICAKIGLSNETVATLKARLATEAVVIYVLSGSNYPGVEYFRASKDVCAAKRSCHLCALLLLSLKEPQWIGTWREEAALPTGPVSLELHISPNSINLLARSGDFLGHPLKVSPGSDELCRGAAVNTESFSDEIFSHILNWCGDCQKHTHCSRIINESSWLPNRVIDVGPPEGSSLPKLYDGSGRSGRYITLTHRWSPLTKECGTMLSNIKQRHVSIDVSKLSKTFQDAVEVARRLDIRYLWIDALCIIQDSYVDWNREASNMMSIYELAWLNIASAGSEGADARLFMKRDPKICRPCRLPPTVSSLAHIHSENTGEDTYAYIPPEFLAQSVFTGFLNRRGWILQERILSPRTVYFGKEELYWECDGINASETIPWGWKDNEVHRVSKINQSLGLLQEVASSQNEAPLSYSHKIGIQDAPLRTDVFFRRLIPDDAQIFLTPTNSLLHRLHEYWRRLVETYSERELTNSLDTLPAVSGLAQALCKSAMPGLAFHKSYCNGLWLEDAVRELLWIESPQSRHLNHDISGAVLRKPSYSWASSDAPVRFILDAAPEFGHLFAISPENETVTDHLSESPQSTALDASSGVLIYGMFTSWTFNYSRFIRDLSGNDDMHLVGLVTRKILYSASGWDPNLHFDQIAKEVLSGRATFHREKVANTVLLDQCHLDIQALMWLIASKGVVWCLSATTTSDQNVKEIVLPRFDSLPADLGLLLIPNVEILDFEEFKKSLIFEERLTTPGNPMSYRRLGVYKIGTIPNVPNKVHEYVDIGYNYMKIRLA